MDPQSPGFLTYLSAWEWRLDVILILGTATALYIAGWWRLRRKGRRKLATGWRLASYLSGITALVLALLSPIDALQSLLFLMHMIQHLLLMMIAPPLLWLGSPMPISVWGLPHTLRRSLGGLLGRNALFRRGLRAATTPFISWLVFVATLWGWHDPAAYDAALRITWLHDLEHITFFGAALLFWWHATTAAPRIHGSFPFAARVAYLLLAFFVNFVPSVPLALANQPIYTFYTEVPRLWGISALQDQRIGGVIMWIPGGMMYAGAILILIIRHLGQSDAGPTPAMIAEAHGFATAAGLGEQANS
jgi:cytochrome c oxidase assembly factor CtaG